MSKLITWKLENRKQIITTKEQENLQALKDYYQEFTNNYPYQNINKLTNITIEELLLSNIILNNYPDISNAIQIFNKYKDYLTKNDYELTSAFICYLNTPRLKVIFNEIKDNPKYMDQFYNAYKKSFSEDKNIDALINLFNILKENPEMEQELTLLFAGTLPEDLKAIFTFYTYLRAYKEVILKSSYPDEESQNFFNLLLKKKVSNAIFITSYMDKLSNEFNTKIRELTQRIREKNKFNSKIDDLIKELNTTTEIKNIDSLMNMCPSDNLKNLILDYVISHNKKYYEELITKVNSLENNTDANLSSLFNSYNYDYSLLTKEEKNLLKTISYSDINEILIECHVLNLTNIEKILPFIDLNKLKLVTNMINAGTLTKTFINTNHYLLKNDNNILFSIIDNINYLSSKNINIINYPNCLNILLSSNIIKNIEILEKYNTSITKTTEDINFLATDDLNLKLDLIIELNMYPLINLDILNNSLDDIYKIYLSNLLNISFSKIKNSSNLIFLAFTRFIPENIINTIKTTDAKKINLPQELEPYKINNLMLNINGVTISLNRVLDNLSKLNIINNETIFYALIYNSYYNIEQIELISKSIYPLTENIYELVRK